MRRAVLALALLASACSRPSQILVHVDAEDGVRAATRSLWIRIWGRDEEEPAFAENNLQFETGTPRPDGTNWPWVVALRPREDDPSRIWRIEASGYEGPPAEDGAEFPPEGDFVAVARASAAYEPGQVRHVYLLLFNDCIGITCEDPNTSCARSGMCEPIAEPTFFDPEAGVPDAGTGMDGSVRRDGAVDREDGGPPCVATAEVCNDLDDDCDENVDEGFDVLTNPQHCGACNTSCDGQHGTGSCAGGACEWVCEPGWLDCDDGVPGCETPMSATDCGACGVTCSGGTPVCDLTLATPMCMAGCSGGSTRCGTSCVNTMISTAHCGACGAACASRPGASVVCATGLCDWTCNAGVGDCDGNVDAAPFGTTNDGCEADLTTTSDCGSCDNACSLASGGCAIDACVDGTCSVDALIAGRPCTLPSGCAGTCDGLGMCMGSCPRDAGPRDAGPRDAGPRDAGPRDAGPRDGGGEAGTDAGCGACDAAACCFGDCCGAGEYCDSGMFACMPLEDGGVGDAGASCGAMCEAAYCCNGACCQADEVCMAGVCAPNPACMCGGAPCCGGMCCEAGACAPDGTGGWLCGGGADAGAPAGCMAGSFGCGDGCCPDGKFCCGGGTTCCNNASCGGGCTVLAPPLLDGT